MIEVVVGRAVGIEVDGVSLALSELLAVAVAHQRERQAERLPASQTADQVHARRDIPPLVRAANLDTAAFGVPKMEEVVGLDQLVAELGVAHAVLALQPGPHALLAQHPGHAEVLAHIAQKVNVGELPHPVVVVHDLRGRRLAVEVQESGQVLANPGEIPLDVLR